MYELAVRIKRSNLQINSFLTLSYHRTVFKWQRYVNYVTNVCTCNKKYMSGRACKKLAISDTLIPNCFEMTAVTWLYLGHSLERCLQTTCRFDTWHTCRHSARSPRHTSTSPDHRADDCETLPVRSWYSAASPYTELQTKSLFTLEIDVIFSFSSSTNVREYVFYVFQISKQHDFLRFFEMTCQKLVKSHKKYQVCWMSIDILASKLPDVLGTYRLLSTHSSQLHSFFCPHFWARCLMLVTGRSVD